MLVSDEIENLPCTAKVRDLAAKFPKTVLDSETVSYSAEFGYMYRYDDIVLRKLPGEEHVQPKIHRGKHVIFSRDREELVTVGYPPATDLPG